MKLRSIFKYNELYYFRKIILEIIEGSCLLSYPMNYDEIDIAIRIIKSEEKYIKVQGISSIINILKTKSQNYKHKVCKLNSVCLYVLKNPDSYVFLNGIKLCTTMIMFTNSDLISILCGEFLNEYETTDYRLNIGEAIIKTNQSSGSLCYKYKNMIINTFLRGCCDEKLEIRCSSFSNIAYICEALPYSMDIFFYEIMIILESTLARYDSQLCKRGAIYLIYKISCGITNNFFLETI